MIFRRFFRRLKHAFDFKEMWNWKFESCMACGCCYRLPYDIKDSIWLKIVGSENGLLCLDCLIKKSVEKSIIIKKEDFNWLCIFGDPDYYSDIWDNTEQMYKEIHRQNKTFNYEDIWDAFVCGCVEKELNPTTNKNDYNKAADAYCKLKESEV